MIKNRKIIQITDDTIIDLSSKKYSKLLFYMDILIENLKERCENEYITAYKVMHEGTGIDYIDKDCFDEVFYEGILSITGVEITAINNKLIYHSSGKESIQNVDFIEYVVATGQHEYELSSLKDLLLKEYGIEIQESRLKNIILGSSKLYYIDDIKMVFGNKDTYLESEIHEYY